MAGSWGLGRSALPGALPFNIGSCPGGLQLCMPLSGQANRFSSALNSLQTTAMRQGEV